MAVKPKHTPVFAISAGRHRQRCANRVRLAIRHGVRQREANLKAAVTRNKQVTLMKFPSNSASPEYYPNSHIRICVIMRRRITTQPEINISVRLTQLPTLGISMRWLEDLRKGSNPPQRLSLVKNCDVSQVRVRCVARTVQSQWKLFPCRTTLSYDDEKNKSYSA